MNQNGWSAKDWKTFSDNLPAGQNNKIVIDLYVCVELILRNADKGQSTIDLLCAHSKSSSALLLFGCPPLLLVRLVPTRYLYTTHIRSQILNMVCKFPPEHQNFEMNTRFGRLVHSHGPTRRPKGQWAPTPFGDSTVDIKTYIERWTVMLYWRFSRGLWCRQLDSCSVKILYPGLQPILYPHPQNAYLDPEQAARDLLEIGGRPDLKDGWPEIYEAFGKVLTKATRPVNENGWTAKEWKTFSENLPAGQNNKYWSFKVCSRNWSSGTRTKGQSTDWVCFWKLEVEQRSESVTRQLRILLSQGQLPLALHVRAPTRGAKIHTGTAASGDCNFGAKLTAVHPELISRSI